MNNSITSKYVQYSGEAKMLCNFCANFDLDALVSLTGYQHHASYSDLLASATGGCVLCEAVRVEHDDSQSEVLGKDNKNDEQASGPIRCSLGLVTSRLQWQWESGGCSKVVAMAVSSVSGMFDDLLLNLMVNKGRRWFREDYKCYTYLR